MDWGTTCSLSDLTEVKEKVLKEIVPNFGIVTPNTLHAKHPHLLSPPSPAVLFPIPPIDWQTFSHWTFDVPFAFS